MRRASNMKKLLSSPTCIVLLFMVMTAIGGCSGDGSDGRARNSGAAESVERGDDMDGDEYFSRENMLITIDEEAIRRDRLNTGTEPAPAVKKKPVVSAAPVAAASLNLEGDINAHGLYSLWQSNSYYRDFFSPEQVKNYHDVDVRYFFHFGDEKINIYVRLGWDDTLYKIGRGISYNDYDAETGQLAVMEWLKGYLFLADVTGYLGAFRHETRYWEFYELSRVESLSGRFREISEEELKGLIEIGNLEGDFAGDSSQSGSLEVSVHYKGKKRINRVHPLVVMVYNVSNAHAWKRVSATVLTAASGKVTVPGLDPSTDYSFIVYRPQHGLIRNPGSGDSHWINGNVFMTGDEFSGDPEILSFDGTVATARVVFNDAHEWDEGAVRALLDKAAAHAGDDDGDGWTDSITVSVKVKTRDIDITAMQARIFAPGKVSVSARASRQYGQELLCPLNPAGNGYYTGTARLKNYHESGVWELAQVSASFTTGAGERGSFTFSNRDDKSWKDTYYYREELKGRRGYVFRRQTRIPVADIADVKTESPDIDGPQLLSLEEISQESDPFLKLVFRADDDNAFGDSGKSAGRAVIREVIPAGQRSDPREADIMLRYDNENGYYFARIWLTEKYYKLGRGLKGEIVLPESDNNWAVTEVTLPDRIGNTSSYFILDDDSYDFFHDGDDASAKEYYLFNYGPLLPFPSGIPMLVFGNNGSYDSQIIIDANQE